MQKPSVGRDHSTSEEHEPAGEAGAGAGEGRQGRTSCVLALGKTPSFILSQWEALGKAAVRHSVQ